MPNTLTDTERLDFLQKLIEHAPGTAIEYKEVCQPNGEDIFEYVIDIEGCDPISLHAPTLREVIDLVFLEIHAA